MTMPPEAEAIPVIMRRTMRNLRTVHDLREERRLEGADVDKTGPVEVTQLVNSFLGALAHPWEALFKDREPERFPELARLSRHLEGARTTPGEEPDLIEQLGYVRNAFAHGNVEFLRDPACDGDGCDIAGVRLWNCRGRPGRQRKTWEIRLDIGGLFALLEDFSETADRLYNPGLVRRRSDCGAESPPTGPTQRRPELPA